MSATSSLRPVRHKNRLSIPEINTYARQMQQCQSRSANLPFEEEDKLKLPSCPQHNRLSTISQRQIPRICLPSHSHRRGSYQYYATGSRKGSLFFKSSRRHSKSYSPSTNCSSRKPSVGYRDNEAFPSTYLYRDASRNSGQFLTTGAAANPAMELKTPDSGYMETTPQGRNLRKAQVVSAIPPHQEYLLHALTTLAINSLTSDLTPGDESERRLAAMGHLLADKTESTSEEGDEQDRLICLPASKSNSSETISNGTSRLDELLDSMEYAADMGSQNQHDHPTNHSNGQGNVKVNNSELKRSRINLLRNYLRFSGFGEPTVIVSSGPQADQFRLARLLQRIRRHDNPQRQERLRLRARLDYEMSLMRAVSFCEQQEQIFFRSASVDMENTDLQMLEDDLKYQAILEMRRNARELRDDERKSDTRTTRPHAFTSNGNTQGKKRMSLSHDAADGHKEPVNSDKPQSPANHRQAPSFGSSFGYSGVDIMSGVLGSPLSKKELKERIHNWLTGVAEAMAGSTEMPLAHHNNNFTQSREQ